MLIYHLILISNSWQQKNLPQKLCLQIIKITIWKFLKIELFCYVALNTGFYLKNKRKTKKQFNKSINETVKFCQQITNFVTLSHGLLKDDLTDG